jgi:hypothetical protein
MTGHQPSGRWEQSLLLCPLERLLLAERALLLEESAQNRAAGLTHDAGNRGSAVIQPRIIQEVK